MGVPGPPESVRACPHPKVLRTRRAATHNEIGPHQNVWCGPPGLPGPQVS